MEFEWDETPMIMVFNTQKMIKKAFFRPSCTEKQVI